MNVGMCCFTPVRVDLSTIRCNLVHMTASSTPTSLGAGQVLDGVPVVPGVRYAPVIRPGRLPAIEDLDPGGELAEDERSEERRVGKECRL